MQHRGRVNSRLLPLSLVADQEEFVVDDKLHCESISTLIYFTYDWHLNRSTSDQIDQMYHVLDHISIS